MTYQEIIKAIESLPIDEQNSLIKLIRQQQQDRRQAELTPAELAQRAEKVKRSQERDEQIRLSMTPEEIEQSRIAFEILDESLRAARGLNVNWE